MKQPIETIKQLIIFLLLLKTLFLTRFELNQLWMNELTNSNYPGTHPTKLQSAFKRFGVIKALLQQGSIC